MYANDFVSSTDDGKKLFRDYGILAKNLVELGAVALVADPDARFGKTKRKIVSLVKVRTLICYAMPNGVCYAACREIL